VRIRDFSLMHAHYVYEIHIYKIYLCKESEQYIHIYRLFTP